MVGRRVDEFEGGVKPSMVGSSGIFVRSQIARCAYLQCEKNAVDGKYCTFHAKRYKQVRADFRKRHAADYSKPRDFECIYIVGSEYFEPVKIGRSVDPLKRLAGMQTGNPYKLKLFGAYMMTRIETVFLEWNIHTELCGMGFSISGEWFDLDKDEAAQVVVKCASNQNIIARTPRDVLGFISGSRTPYDPDEDWLMFRDNLAKMDRAIRA